MKRRAARVIATVTPQPACTSRETTVAVLYAAIPPQTHTSTWRPVSDPASAAVERVRIAARRDAIPARPFLRLARCVFRRFKSGRLVIDADSSLQNRLDDDFHLGFAVGIDHRAGALEQFQPALLDQGRQAEPSADLVDNLVALERINHVLAFSTARMSSTLWTESSSISFVMICG